MPKFPTLISLLFLTVLVAACGIGDKSSAQYIAAAQQYLADGSPRSAVIVLKNALQQTPEDAELRLFLGEIYLEQNDALSARKELERAASLGADADRVQPLLARTMLLQGDYDAVLTISATQEQLSQASRVGIYASRGKAGIQTGKFEEARLELDKGLATDNQSPDVLHGLAMLAVYEGKFDHARLRLAEVFALDHASADAWSLLGRLESLEGNLDEARAAFARAMEIRPGPDYAASLITIDIGLGDLDQALAAITELRASGVKIYILDYLEGLVAYLQERHRDAQGLFRNALKVNPKHERTLYYTGASHVQTGELNLANSILQRHEVVRPGLPGAQKMMAWIALKLSDYSEAERLIRPVLAQDPDDPYSISLLASAIEGNNRSGEVLELLQQLVEIEPQSARARISLGDVMIKEGAIKAGLTELESARELEPDNPQVTATLISAYLRAQELDKALTAAMGWIDSEPGSVAANAILATVYLRLEESNKAIAAFQAALVLDPINLTAQSGLASIAVQAGDTERAKSFYRKILEHHPADLTTSMNLAQLLALNGESEEMTQVLIRAIEANPDALRPRLALSQYQMSQLEYQQALDWLLPVMKQGEDNYTFIRLVSEAQYRVGDFTNARDTLSKMLAMAPNYPQGHYFLSIVLRRLGDLADSKKELEQVLSLQPTHIGARYQLLELLILESDEAAARAQIALLKEGNGDSATLYSYGGMLETRLGRHEEAVTAFRAAFEIKETNYNLLQLEGALWSAGKQTEAMTLMRDWLAKLPADQLPGMRLAGRYLETNEESEAKRIYQSLLESDSENAAVLNNMAWLMRDSATEKATIYAEKAYALSPDSTTAWDTLAVVISRSDPKRAQTLIQAAVDAAPDNPTYRYHQALILSRDKQFEKALRILDRLLQDSPAFPEADKARMLVRKLQG